MTRLQEVLEHLNIARGMLLDAMYVPHGPEDNLADAIDFVAQAINLLETGEPE